MEGKLFFIDLNYLNFSRTSKKVAETKIVAPAPTNTPGVLGGVQERPGVLQGGPEIVKLLM